MLTDRIVVEEDSATAADNGLILFASGGLILNRHANVRLNLGLRGYYTLFKFDGEMQPGIMFNMGILFSGGGKGGCIMFH